MTHIENPHSQASGPREQLPLSLLNDYLYCPRRAALKGIEGWREANEHTERGDIVHEHSDLPGYEVAKGVTLLRALPVFSDRLGLNGKCDIVEVRGTEQGAGSREQGAGGLGPQAASPESGVRSQGGLFPVEFKLGKRRRWENDDVQLCAQALCLEEMFGVPVPRGAIFHADSKRRREVEFTPELRRITEEAVAALHALLRGTGSSDRESEIPRLPVAAYREACRECSLYDICLPKVSAEPDRLRRASVRLFHA